MPEPLIVPWCGRQLRVRHVDPHLGAVDETAASWRWWKAYPWVEDEEGRDRMGSTLKFPWRHDGYELIRVVIARDLRDESRALLVAFRALRQATTLDEVRAEADDIAHAKGVRLTWATEPDPADTGGHRITISVLRA